MGVEGVERLGWLHERLAIPLGPGDEGTDSYMSFDVASAMPRISRPSWRETAQYQW